MKLVLITLHFTRNALAFFSQDQFWLIFVLILFMQFIQVGSRKSDFVALNSKVNMLSFNNPKQEILLPRFTVQASPQNCE